MAAALEETSITYEELADIETEFDEAETEIIRQQVALTKSLYARRSKTVSQIPNFWPLVLEQAPPEIDQYIQPSDSALLFSSLTSLSVTNFELDIHPRSVAITWEFSPNEYFEDTVLEKKFWYRKSLDGWTGLVSEPVRIQWKKDRDLTGGLLEMVYQAWETRAQEEYNKETGLSPEQSRLKKKIENTGMGGLSFFAWFGYIGRHVSAEESTEATKKENEKRIARKMGKTPSPPASDDGEEDDDEDTDLSMEIFPDGSDLAIAITEDLWPGAIRYFIQAQEQDAVSDADFESGDEGGDTIMERFGDEDDEDAERPRKKSRAV